MTSLFLCQNGFQRVRGPAGEHGPRVDRTQLANNLQFIRQAHSPSLRQWLRHSDGVTCDGAPCGTYTATCCRDGPGLTQARRFVTITLQFQASLYEDPGSRSMPCLYPYTDSTVCCRGPSLMATKSAVRQMPTYAPAKMDQPFVTHALYPFSHGENHTSECLANCMPRITSILLAIAECLPLASPSSPSLLQDV